MPELHGCHCSKDEFSGLLELRTYGRKVYSHLPSSISMGLLKSTMLWAIDGMESEEVGLEQ